MIYVLDTCALIAFFQREPGWEVVRDSFVQANASHLIHAVNLAELYYDYYNRDGREAAEGSLRRLKQMRIGIYRSMDTHIIREAAETKALFRRISIADCFAVATARRARGVALTADRREFGPVASAGHCRVIFIR